MRCFFVLCRNRDQGFLAAVRSEWLAEILGLIVHTRLSRCGVAAILATLTLFAEIPLAFGPSCRQLHAAPPGSEAPPPDITGNWLLRSGKVEQVSTGTVEVAEVWIRRRYGDGEFQLVWPHETQPKALIVAWKPDRRRFEGRIPDSSATVLLTLEPDEKIIRATFTRDEANQPTVKDADSTNILSHQNWSRTMSKINDVAFDKELARAQPREAPLVDGPGFQEHPGERFGYDKTTNMLQLAPIARGRGISNTPAAKQLDEQLAAQESAAAAEAAAIRQLQAIGQAEQNKQSIAEHQRKLKNLLSTAFDLKLQVEELHVKELQARLSQLERQIGQRKELREKIINRR